MINTFLALCTVKPVINDPLIRLLYMWVSYFRSYIKVCSHTPMPSRSLCPSPSKLNTVPLMTGRMGVEQQTLTGKDTVMMTALVRVNRSIELLALWLGGQRRTKYRLLFKPIGTRQVVVQSRDRKQQVSLYKLKRTRIKCKARLYLIHRQIVKSSSQ